jgi:hypothetical protein
MGDVVTPIELDQLVHRQRMRIRTVAVSFGAAIHSARHDLEVGGAERDALIETWRAWSLGVLDEYRADFEARRAAATDDATRAAFDGLLADLADARETVRTA